MQAKDNGDDATFFDIDPMARWRFLGGSSGHLSGAAVVGWRKTDVKLDYTDGSTTPKPTSTSRGCTTA